MLRDTIYVVLALIEYGYGYRIVARIRISRATLVARQKGDKLKRKRKRRKRGGISMKC